MGISNCSSCCGGTGDKILRIFSITVSGVVGTGVSCVDVVGTGVVGTGVVGTGVVGDTSCPTFLFAFAYKLIISVTLLLISEISLAIFVSPLCCSDANCKY